MGTKLIDMTYEEIVAHKASAFNIMMNVNMLGDGSRKLPSHIPEEYSIEYYFN